MPGFFSTLRFRLLFLVLLALVPALGLVLYDAAVQRQAAAAQVQDNALLLARLAASNHQEVIEGTHQLLIVLAQLPVVRELEPATCSEFFIKLLTQYPRYANFGVIKANGELVCLAIPSRVPDREPGLFFPRVLETRDFAVGAYEVGRGSGRNVVVFGYPIFDSAYQLQAVIMASLDLASFSHIAVQPLLPQGSTLTVIDSDGTILARSPDHARWVGHSMPETSIARDILNSKTEGTAEAIGEDGVSRLYAFTPMPGVPGKDMFVTVGIPTAVAFAQVNDLLLRNLAALAAIALVALAASGAGANLFVLRQVNALSTVTNRLASGDLTARTGLRYGVGELDQLALAFDRMVTALQQRAAERRRAEEQARQWSSRLEGLINAVADATSQPLQVNHIVEMVLRSTLQVMELPAGIVFLQRGTVFVKTAYYGLEPDLVSTIPVLEAPHHAPEILAQLVSCRNDGASPAQTWTNIPIKSKGRALGFMSLQSRSEEGLTAQDLRVLAAVGQQLGVAIENAELYEQVQTLAALKERERLSRELHDGLAQVLGVLCVRNSLASELLNSGQVDRAREQLQELQTVTQEAYQDVREAILGLRVSLSGSRDLPSTLAEYAHKFSQQTGICVEVDCGGEDVSLTPEAEVQVLRIIQEALANVRKHSGARQAWVRLEREAERVLITIRDDGRGFDPASINRDGQHFGLQTMRERAEGVGGQLTISSAPGHGTTIKVMLA